MRELRSEAFDAAYQSGVLRREWQEAPPYYERYKARYEGLLRRFSELAPPRPLDLLEVGGGQLALMCKKLWSDSPVVADVSDSCFSSLSEDRIETFVWDLAAEDPPTSLQVDAVILSEVIEHLPVPAHVALRRLAQVTRPGGFIVCSTPNLYRLRNIGFLLLGRPIFDHFDLPGRGGCGHVLEYSAEHLGWQFQKAGLVDCRIELCEWAHTPERSSDRLLSVLGTPLHTVPRFRSNLLASARVP